MGRQYQLDNPSFSRIYINFKNKKNPVKFELPNQENKFNAVYRTLSTIMTKGMLIIPYCVIIFFLLFKSHISNGWIILGICLYSFVLFPLIVTIIFAYNKKLSSALPKIFKWANNSDLKRIKIIKLNSKIYEVPIFDNVFLEYKATEDFGKYLERIQITEHDFYYQKKKLFSKKFKKEQNDEYWKVKFLFSKIPKTGLLEIEFI